MNPSSHDGGALAQLRDKLTATTLPPKGGEVSVSQGLARPQRCQTPEV